MTKDWKRMERRIAEAEEARRAAAIGAERRKQRRKARAERNVRIGLLIVPLVALALATVACVVEVIV